MTKKESSTTSRKTWSYDAYWHDGQTDTKGETWKFHFPYDAKYAEEHIDSNWHMSLTIMKPCGCTIHINADTVHCIPCSECDSALTDEEIASFKIYKSMYIDTFNKRKETK